MILGNFIRRHLFTTLFSLGLFLLILDAAKDFLYLFTKSDVFALSVISLSAIGLIICLISIPFLMVEWLVSPLGTQAKRIKFYQGAGNLMALAMLIAGWNWREGSARQLTEVASLAFSTGGLITALIFGWTGKEIAAFISEKRIQFESIGTAAQRYVAQNTAAGAVRKNSVLESKLSSGDLIKGVSSAPLIQS
jgi:uncharacterized membrane protein